MKNILSTKNILSREIPGAAVCFRVVVILVSAVSVAHHPRGCGLNIGVPRSFLRFCVEEISVISKKKKKGISHLHSH